MKFPVFPKGQKKKKPQGKASSDNRNFSLELILFIFSCSMVSNSDWWLTNTTYPKAVGCFRWSRGCRESLDSVMLWINMWARSRCQEGVQLWASTVVLVHAAGSTSCGFTMGSAFNFLSLTEWDCLWQSKLSTWHTWAWAKGLTVLVSVRRDLTSKCAALGENGLEGPCSVPDQRMYLVFKVSSQLSLLHLLMGKGPIAYTEKWVRVFIRCPKSRSSLLISIISFLCKS